MAQNQKKTKQNTVSRWKTWRFEVGKCSFEVSCTFHNAERGNLHEPGHVHVLKATKSHESRSSANDLFTPVMNFQKFTGRMIDVPELTQMSGLCSCCFCFFNVCSAALLSFSSFSIMVCNIAKHDGVIKKKKNQTTETINQRFCFSIRFYHRSATAGLKPDGCTSSTSAI